MTTMMIRPSSSQSYNRIVSKYIPLYKMHTAQLHTHGSCMKNDEARIVWRHGNLSHFVTAAIMFSYFFAFILFFLSCNTNGAATFFSSFVPLYRIVLSAFSKVINVVSRFSRYFRDEIVYMMIWMNRYTYLYAQIYKTITFYTKKRIKYVQNIWCLEYYFFDIHAYIQYALY